MTRILLPTQTLAEQVETACLLESAAPKAGNVSPGVSFEDVTFQDFVISARCIAPLLGEIATMGVGRTILAAVQATRSAVNSNTNLGIILLLSPLAAIPADQSCAHGIATVLQKLTLDDARSLYQAISFAQPGGLGKSDKHDVSSIPEVSIFEAMSQSKDRDLIARQYVTNFDLVLNFGCSVFLEAINAGQNWSTAIQTTQLRLMALFSDSLIVRKCGQEIGAVAQQLAADVLNADWPHSPSDRLYQEFDTWLRADGHRRNPGTTADMIAAILFSTIRDKLWTPPQDITIESFVV